MRATSLPCGGADDSAFAGIGIAGETGAAAANDCGCYIAARDEYAVIRIRDVAANIFCAGRSRDCEVGGVLDGDVLGSAAGIGDWGVHGGFLGTKADNYWSIAGDNCDWKRVSVYQVAGGVDGSGIFVDGADLCAGDATVCDLCAGTVSDGGAAAGVGDLQCGGKRGDDCHAVYCSGAVWGPRSGRRAESDDRIVVRADIGGGVVWD